MLKNVILFGCYFAQWMLADVIASSTAQSGDASNDISDDGRNKQLLFICFV
jgi:hypothetical protein